MTTPDRPDAIAPAGRIIVQRPHWVSEAEFHAALLEAQAQIVRHFTKIAERNARLQRWRAKFGPPSEET